MRALNRVTLSAYAGEAFGLLGPNGAGKTTLIKILLGVVRPSNGSASLFGQTAGSREASRRVGYLPASLRIDRHHTARSALRFYGRLSGMSEKAIRYRSDELLELVGLKGRDRESVKRFSKGMYQRLGHAQALMHDPDLLVLDEPTDGLDPVGRRQVRDVIEHLRDQGKTIFLNSHILQEVEMVCSRVAIMASGEIRGIGTIEELAHAHGEARAAIVFSSTMGDSSPTASEGPDDRWVDELVSRVGLDHTQVPISAVGDSVRLELPASDQSSIDGTIDFIREQRRSIYSVTITRPSLEQTFLRLVDSPSKSTYSENESAQKATSRVTIEPQESKESQP